MTNEEMARTAVEIGADDAAALERFADLEDAAFEAHQSDYAQALMVCAGSHDG